MGSPVNIRWMIALRWFATVALVGVFGGLAYTIEAEKSRWDAALGQRVAAAGLLAEADGDLNRAVALLRVASALGAGPAVDARLVRLSGQAHREWALDASPSAVAFADDRLDVRQTNGAIVEIDPTSGAVGVASRTADPAPTDDPSAGIWSGDLFFSGVGRKASLFRRGHQAVLESPVGRVVSAGFDTAGRFLAVATANRRVHLWALAELPPVGDAPDAVAPQRITKIDGPKVEIVDGSRIAASVTLDVDVSAGVLAGRTLVVATAADELVARAADGHTRWKRSDAEIDGLAVSPAEDVVAARHADGRLSLYDLEQGEVIATYRGSASLGAPVAFGFSADGRDVFIGRTGYRLPDRRPASVRRSVGRLSNLRPCEGDFLVVAVSPYPSPSTLWADTATCRAARQ
jgi:hypothetical protein